MEIAELLSRLPYVEGHRSITNGIDHNTPYHTFTYQGVTVLGLRENVKRIALFKSLRRKWDRSLGAVLDIGCNLGTVGNAVGHGCSVGIDEDPAIVGLGLTVHPTTNFLCSSVNITRLGDKDLPKFPTTLCLSMLEYVKDKEKFLIDLYRLTERLCIIEGHSMDLLNGNADHYEALIRRQPWQVERLDELTDAGLNAPKESPGRPVWVCLKGG